MATSRGQMPPLEPEGAGPAAARKESRRMPRHAMTSAVRLGWINDSKRMEYVSGTGIDISEGGIGVMAEQRLRLSALVHLEVADRGLVGIGRVRNCIRSLNGWRTGIELVPER